MAARINIDVDLSLDPRFKALVQIVGCEFKAYGMMVIAIQIAQRYWAPKNEEEHRGLVPKDIWENMHLGPLLKAGLAIEKDSGIYLKGSQERFEWIISVQKNGRKGGRPKKTQVTEIIENEKPRNNLEITKNKPTNNLTINTPINIPTPTLLKLNTNTNTGVELLAFKNAWNENCGNLPKVLKLGSTRSNHVKARLKENPSIEYWIEIIKRLVASDFCNGQNSRNWVADFDFLVKPETQFKVLEGKYDSKTKPIKPRKILDGDNIV